LVRRAREGPIGKAERASQSGNMDKPPNEREFLEKIPSPSARLWAGLCVILSIFIIFAVYSIRQIRWLEDYQINVVQRNRKASIELLRIQNDANLLGISLRDMTLKQADYPILDWQPTFTRLQGDMSNALLLEMEDAVSAPETQSKTEELGRQMQDFWQAVDRVFNLAQQGKEAEARSLIQSEVESKDAMMIATVSSLLRSNDLAQIDAARKINQVYESFKRDNLVLLGILLLLAIGTGLYTFQANRKTFEKLSHLAQRLQSQSEQLRKLSWKLIDVQEETLRQVAHDLHDEFGQILTAIGIMLNRAGQKAASFPAEMLREIHAVKSVVEETLQNVRDRSQMFRPAILDDFGLGKTLEWFVDQFSRQTGIQVALEGEPEEISFPGDEAIHIYRIVQEALSNVARHSQAKEARVMLKEEGQELVIQVCDDGVGFSPVSGMDQAAGEGFGLMGMRERAERLNGTLSIRSAPGKGTTVTARIPVRKIQPEAVGAGEKVK